MLVPKGDEVARVDVAASEWKEPSEDAIGFWRCQMPEAAAKKLRPAPNGLLLDTLSELLDHPEQESLAYLLALLLVRRRVLSEEEKLIWDDSEKDNANQEDASQEGEAVQFWSLTCAADGRQWNVPVSEPPLEQLLEVQQQLNDLLFTEE